MYFHHHAVALGEDKCEGFYLNKYTDIRLN